jgi:hypothetical protein
MDDDLFEVVVQVRHLLRSLSPMESQQVLEEVLKGISSREYLTVDEARRALRVGSRSTIYARAHRHGINVCDGRLRRSDLDALFVAGRRKHGSSRRE